jgi:hypothetical protein
LTLQENRLLRKTDNISIRIDSDLSNKLHEKCIERKISLNTLINHLLEKQVNWNELVNDLGWITLFRTTFRELMDANTKEKIQKIAETTATIDLKNSLNYFYGQISLDSILDLFKKRCQNMNVQFRVIPTNNAIKIIIQHDLGKNWPFFIITQMNTILNEIEYRIINEDCNTQGFSFEIVKVGDK